MIHQKDIIFTIYKLYSGKSCCIILNKLNWHQNLFLTRQITRLSPDPVGCSLPATPRQCSGRGRWGGWARPGCARPCCTGSRTASGAAGTSGTGSWSHSPRPPQRRPWWWLQLSEIIQTHCESMLDSHCDWWSLHDGGQLTQRIICVKIQFRPGPPRAVDKSFINSG